MSFLSVPISISCCAGQFALILGGLRRTVPKYNVRDRNAGPIIILIFNYLGRLAARFAALASRAQAGISSRLSGRRNNAVIRATA